MKKKQNKQRKNQKVKRASKGTNQGCRYRLSGYGLLPFSGRDILMNSPFI